MGSTTTGRLGDYSSPRGPGDERAGAGTGGEGPRDDDDPCARPISDQLLEEMERCPYFERTGTAPPVGTDVVLLEDLVGGRLAVATMSEREVIGYLPTTRNYLRACLQAGWKYAGEITESRSQPTAVVFVSLQPSQ